MLDVMPSPVIPRSSVIFEFALPAFFANCLSDSARMK